MSSKKSVYLAISYVIFLIFLTDYLNSGDLFVVIFALLVAIPIFIILQRYYTDEATRRLKAELEGGTHLTIELNMKEIMQSSGAKTLYKRCLEDPETEGDYEKFLSEVLSEYENTAGIAVVNFSSRGQLLFKDNVIQNGTILLHSLEIGLKDHRRMRWIKRSRACIEPRLEVLLIVVNGKLQIKVGRYDSGVSPDNTTRYRKIYEDVCEFPLYCFGAYYELHPCFLNGSYQSTDTYIVNGDLREHKEFLLVLADYKSIFYEDRNFRKSDERMRERRVISLKKQQLTADGSWFYNKFMSIHVSSVLEWNEERKAFGGSYSEL